MASKIWHWLKWFFIGAIEEDTCGKTFRLEHVLPALLLLLSIAGLLVAWLFPIIKAML